MEQENTQKKQISETQAELLELLKRFHAVCTEHGIHYSVHAGTMIGIVREQGFIPWDDDADISFTREEFDTFRSLLGSSEIGSLFRAEEGEFFYFSLYDNAFPQLWMARWNRPPVWLDFFIYDFVSEKPLLRKIKKAGLAFVLGFLKNRETMVLTRKRNLYSGPKYAVIYGAYLLGKLFSPQRKFRIAERVRKSFPGSKTLIHRANDRYIGIGFVYPKDVMEEYLLLPFEDTRLMVTRRYEEILVPSYGDYKKPVKDDSELCGVHTLHRYRMPFTIPPVRISAEEMEKLRFLEMKCLLEWDRICKKYGIAYFLGGGTLLGAVRHQGFIPWDDDIDVMLLPEEYEKFRAVVSHELSPEFVYQTAANDPEYHSPFDKIRLKGTVFDTYFSRQFDLKSHGIFIDIFVHDSTAARPLAQKIHIFRTVLARSFVRHKWDDSPMHFYGKFKLFCRFADLVKSCTSMETLEKRQKKQFTRYNGKHTGFLYDSRGEHTKYGAFPEALLTGGTMEMEFEGHGFPVPVRYDEYLKFSYKGDYETLPPPEKRFPGHDLAHLDFGIYKNL